MSTGDEPAPDDATLQHYIVTLNKWIGEKELPWFVCDGCNKLLRGDPIPLETSKWGYERVFCRACVRHCRVCKVNYAPPMEYQHEDCEAVREERGGDSGEDSCGTGSD